MPLQIAPVRAFEAVVDFLYPPCCILCHVPTAGRTVGVCPDCSGSMTAIARSDDAWKEAEEKLCGDGLLDGLHALYLFEKTGALQAALHLLKYAGMHSIGVHLGRDLGRSLAASTPVTAFDVALPVPLHGAKLRERGYNQSERICAGIRAATGLAVNRRALRRTRHTRSQTTLKIHEREENVRGAFEVARRGERSVREASIILVDDVLTTGATLRACARAVKNAGAASVVCAAVAIAP